jgi:hypothetical protein
MNKQKIMGKARLSSQPQVSYQKDITAVNQNFVLGSSLKDE